LKVSYQIQIAESSIYLMNACHRIALLLYRLITMYPIVTFWISTDYKYS